MEEEYSKDRPPSLMGQLADVQAHIEDLHIVIDRTTEAVDLDLYNSAVQEPGYLDIIQVDFIQAHYSKREY